MSQYANHGIALKLLYTASPVLFVPNPLIPRYDSMQLGLIWLLSRSWYCSIVQFIVLCTKNVISGSLTVLIFVPIFCILICR